MSGPAITIGVTNIFCGLLFIAISIPLVMRKVPMNKWYGIRVTKSFQSDELWYDINEYGGRQFIIWAIPVLIAGIASFFIPIRINNSPSTILPLLLGPGCILACVAIAVIRTLVYSNKR